MSKKNDGGPTGVFYAKYPRMSSREYAAIELCVPDSGIDWLDDMIRQSLCDRFAGMALQGMLAGVESNPDCMVAALADSESRGLKIYEHFAQRAFKEADAMIAERTKREGSDDA